MEPIPVPGEEQLQEITRPRESSPWLWVILASGLAAFFWAPFMTCMCSAGSVKSKALLLGTCLIWVRALWGLLRRDRSSSWIVYFLLSLTLGGIVTIIAHLAGYH